jgi:hypothetical protein
MPSAAAIGAIAAVAWFAVFVGAQAFALRRHGNGARSLAASGVIAVAGFVISTLAATLVTGERGAASALALVFGGVTGFCLFALYVPFLYTILASLSVQSLIVLKRRGGTAPEAELFGDFAGSDIVRGRLETLSRSGYLVTRGDGYALTPRGRSIAVTFATVKRLWRLGHGG